MTAMNKRLIQTSKYLAKYLRHTPGELGLTLQPGGWVSVDDLLGAAARNGFVITYDDLVECVETNDKQRFAFDASGELILRQSGTQRRDRLAARGTCAPRGPLSWHRRAVPAVDLQRRAGPRQTAPRASLDGYGYRTQGRSTKRSTPDPHRRRTAYVSRWIQVLALGEWRLAYRFRSPRLPLQDVSVLAVFVTLEPSRWRHPSELCLVYIAGGSHEHRRPFTSDGGRRPRTSALEPRPRRQPGAATRSRNRRVTSGGEVP